MVSTIVSIPGSRNKCIRSGVNSPLKMDFKNKKPFEIFVAYIVREKKLFIIDTICAVLVAAIDLAFPYVSKNSMQTYLPQSMYKTFFIVMAILAAAYVLKAALYYVITVLGHRMGVNIESRMREDLYSHMQALSFGFYDKNRTGTLVSRLTGDLFEITELAHHGPENIIICALTIVGSMLIMFTINWQLNAEFANGASRVFASEDLLRPDAQGRRALQDDLFVGLPDDPANVGVTVYSPALREGSYLARKQDLLRGCESLLGLRRGILSEVESPAEPRTATEIAATSVDYDLTIRDLQSAWTDAVQQAMALCSALGAVYGLDGLPQTAAPAIDWGDGVLYDRARIWAEQRELVDAGLLRPELALAWYFDLPHETEAELAEIRRRFMGDAGRAQ